MRERKLITSITATVIFIGGSIIPSLSQRLPLEPGVKLVCSINFNKNSKLPARVEDAALPCLKQAAQKLKDTPNIKLVLVGISHPLYDHEELDHGMEREGEDMTGADIRFSDIAAYRAVNTKAYFTQWLNADPTKIIPTTDEYKLGRKVIIYTVPGNANFFHNYTKTTPINESKCTIKPCPIPTEDVLTPQLRPRIGSDRANQNHS